MTARLWTLLLTFLLATAAVAGCFGRNGDDEEDDEDDDVEPTPTPEVTPTPTVATPSPTPTPPPTTPTPPTGPTIGPTTFTLAAVGAPTQVKPGQAFNFTLDANGTPSVTTDHIGAHYSANETSAPSATTMQACDHQGGALPGQYLVNCTLAAQGTWHVYGHARYNASGTLVNWWATPFTVKVRDFNVTISGLPTNPVASNTSFSFQVNISGIENVTSDHFGAHFWNASEPNPTTANSMGACDHLAGGVVGNWTITCKIPNSGLAPKDFFVRGHLRVTDGATQLSWWSPEGKVSILGTLPVGSPI